MAQIKSFYRDYFSIRILPKKLSRKLRKMSLKIVKIRHFCSYCHFRTIISQTEKQTAKIGPAQMILNIAGYPSEIHCQENWKKSDNKTPAEQRDIFRPKLFYNDMNLRLNNSQCTMKMQRSSKKRVVIHLSPF